MRRRAAGRAVPCAIEAANAANVIPWDVARHRVARGGASRTEPPRSLSQPYAVDHLAHPRQPEASSAEDQADREIDQVIMQRQQTAVEQGEMDEAHRERQDAA